MTEGRDTDCACECVDYRTTRKGLSTRAWGQRVRSREARARPTTAICPTSSTTTGEAVVHRLARAASTRRWTPTGAPNAREDGWTKGVGDGREQRVVLGLVVPWFVGRHRRPLSRSPRRRRDHIDRVALVPQPAADRAGELGALLDDEQPHRGEREAASDAQAAGARARRRRSGDASARRGPSVVLVDAHDLGGRGVDLDVMVADVDVEHEPAVEVFEVHLVERARGGGLRGLDGPLLGDLCLREQILAVIQPGTGSGGRTAGRGERGATRGDGGG